MILRKLKLEDAPLMLEWMHDRYVVENLNKNYLSKTITDCECFIKQALIDTDNIHLAIDCDGEYMGTVSLKNIDDKQAEFAISIRRVAMNKDISRFAMQEIIKIAFEKLKLQKIYWYVRPENIRAQKFYDKNGFMRITKPIDIKNNNEDNYIWYQKENSYEDYE